MKEVKAIALVSLFDEEKGFVLVRFQFKMRPLLRYNRGVMKQASFVFVVGRLYYLNHLKV